MDATTAIKLIKAHKATLEREFAVCSIAVFGSFARGEEGRDSDIDILVSFDGPATSQRYFGLQFYLEDLLGCDVDLVSDKALRSEIRPFVEREAIRV